MTKSDLMMAISAINSYADYLEFSDDEENEKASEKYRELSRRMSVEYYKKYNKNKK